MISAIEWVPAGVADPSPKKYEFSQAELDLIQLMDEHNMDDLQDVQAHLGKQQEQKDREEAAANKKSSSKEKKPHVENTLPADLRMDEYSSDDEDDEAARGTAIGRLLVDGDEGVDVMEDDDDSDDNDEDEDDNVDERGGRSKTHTHDSDDESDDDDDDLADVPDTREYTPVDLEGLKAIGLSQVGTNAPAYMDDLGDGDDDNDSEADDVMIRPNDAIIVVAKTEEVRPS